jgi:hypothetical protein
MAKYLFIAQCDCTDSTREKEFIEWMDKVHIPDVLATPGIVRAERYININPEETKRPEYVAMYEIETDDIKKFKAELHKTIEKIGAGGRVLKFAVPETAYPFSTPFYKRVKTFKKPSVKK